MVMSSRAAAAVNLLATILLNGCALAPQAPDTALQISALERWNQCLERYDTDIEHYCDGHRRDLLNAFPIHKRHRVNILLMKKTRAVSQSRALKTRMNTESENPQAK